MNRLLVLIALSALAVVVALILQRRRPDPPSAPSYRAPTQLDRKDFTATGARLLLAVFASATCETCPRAWAAAVSAADRFGQSVGVQRIDVQHDPDLHRRYRIDGVPTTIIADDQGVVVRAFFGPVTEDEVIEALTAAAS